jgi:hypothetical protein
MVFNAYIYIAGPLVSESNLLQAEIIIAKRKNVNRQVLIKFRKKLFKKVMKHYGVKSKNSLILFGVRKNCLIC